MSAAYLLYRRNKQSGNHHDVISGKMLIIWLLCMVGIIGGTITIAVLNSPCK